MAVQASDARSRRLPLVSVGDGPPLHDWGCLLARMGILDNDRFLGRAPGDTRLLLMSASLLAGAWVASGVRMKRRRADTRRTE